MSTKQPSLSFYNIKQGIIQKDIWAELEAGLWQEYLIDNQIANNTIGAKNLTKWKPVFNEFVPIYPGSKWNSDEKYLQEDLFYPSIKKNTKDGFYALCEAYFASFKGKHIAVHLSGGLDSSIIIGILNLLNIPFSLIGLTSRRFEFRTERRVQEVLGKFGNNTILLDLDAFPFYSNLNQIPAHQIPDNYIKDNQGHLAMASTCNKLGIDVVFSGQGGDTIFVDSIPVTPDSWSCNIGNEFQIPWYQDILYPTFNIELVSFYANKNIIEALYNLRLGQGCDPLKRWARQYFKDILPSELVNYTYCADFFGISMDGLQKAKPEIEILFKRAYELVGHPIFSPSSTVTLLKTDVFNLEFSTYTDICNRISIAVWYNSLLEGNIINKSNSNE